MSFGDIENSIQILCKKTVLPLLLAKWSLEVSNRNEANMKVVGNDKINQTEEKYEFLELSDRPQSHSKHNKGTPKGSH